MRPISCVLGLGIAVLASGHASAMCIENRSDRNIAYVHGEPFADMSKFYQGVVGPRGYACSPMPISAEGKTPMSIYVVDDRGRCQVSTGCFYANADDQNVFVGMGTNGCVTSFKVTDCATR